MVIFWMGVFLALPSLLALLGAAAAWLAANRAPRRCTPLNRGAKCRASYALGAIVLCAFIALNLSLGLLLAGLLLACAR